MIKFFREILCCFWMMAPVAYFVARLMGVYNFQYDVLIMLALSAIATLVVFLTYEGN